MKNVLPLSEIRDRQLPTFCYHSELSTYGACRMCVVEDDRGKYSRPVQKRRGMEW